MPAPERPNKNQPFGKTDVATTYEALSAEKQKQISAILEQIAARPDGPMTLAEVSAGYETLDDQAKMRISQIMRRSAARAANQT